ncbi:MAG: DHH family phosphoesterase, partial [Thermodesulfobacteriota bacterium]
MDPMRIERFLAAARSAAASLNGTSPGDVTLVHHNDTDGITSGAILGTALVRAGFSVEHIPIERVHRAFLPAIHRPGRRLILYADLGGQAADSICRHIRGDSRVIIIDHHLPAPGTFPRLEQVNPELFGISGDGECAAAAAACFF